MREAVSLEPAGASYWNSLGMILGGRNDLGEAEKAFREAVSRDPASARYRFNLGLVLERQGRAADATEAYRAALGADPAFAPAQEKLRGPR